MTVRKYFDDVRAGKVMPPDEVKRLADALQGTIWLGSLGRVFHWEASDWVQSGRAVCGANLRHPHTEIRSPMPDLHKLCKKCLARLPVPGGAL